MAANPVEPDLALYQSLPHLLRNLLRNPFEPDLGAEWKPPGNFSGTWSGFALKPPRPAPETCWTWPGSAQKPPRPSPDPLSSLPRSAPSVAVAGRGQAVSRAPRLMGPLVCSLSLLGPPRSTCHGSVPRHTSGWQTPLATQPLPAGGRPSTTPWTPMEGGLPLRGRVFCPVPGCLVGFGGVHAIANWCAGRQSSRGWCAHSLAPLAQPYSLPWVRA